MTVFVPQQPQERRRPDGTTWTPDLSSAAHYGDIRFVFQGGEQPHRKPAEALERARQVLKDFDPSSDFLCWASNSDPSALFVTMMAVMELEPRSLRFLIWDRQRGNRAEGCYLPIEYQLTNY